MVIHIKFPKEFGSTDFLSKRFSMKYLYDIHGDKPYTGVIYYYNNGGNYIDSNPNEKYTTRTSRHIDFKEYNIDNIYTFLTKEEI